LLRGIFVQIYKSSISVASPKQTILRHHPTWSTWSEHSATGLGERI